MREEWNKWMEKQNQDVGYPIKICGISNAIYAIEDGVVFERSNNDSSDESNTNADINEYIRVYFSKNQLINLRCVLWSEKYNRSKE